MAATRIGSAAPAAVYLEKPAVKGDDEAEFNGTKKTYVYFKPKKIELLDSATDKIETIDKIFEKERLLAIDEDKLAIDFTVSNIEYTEGQTLDTSSTTSFDDANIKLYIPADEDIKDKIDNYIIESDNSVNLVKGLVKNAIRAINTMIKQIEVDERKELNDDDNYCTYTKRCKAKRRCHSPI